MTFSWILAGALALAQAAADEPVTLEGIGPLRVGLSAETLRTRFDARREEGFEPDEYCSYWHSPSHPGIALMVVDGRLVRIDIADPTYRTRSGAHVGMGQAEILALYGPRMRVEPHPYTAPEGTYLVYRARSQPFGLIVETSDGRAESMRVGYWENVQWIEGCS